MTTPAQLSAQLVELMTRWNAQQDQLSDWLTGSPAGGPNGDGRYPLTKADGTTRLFLCLPAIISTVEGPAAQAGQSADEAQDAATAAQSSQAAVAADRAAVAAIRDEIIELHALIEVQRQDVAAKWADVQYWHETAAANAAATAEDLALVEAIYNELIDLRDQLLNPTGPVTFDRTSVRFSFTTISMDAA